MPDMEFVKNFTPPDFQAKNFTPSISPNFNSFSDKNTKNEWKWRNLHCWQKFYTAAGSDGIDKFQLWDGHLIFTGLKCNVQSFMDRPQATAITLRGEFLFKSLLTLFHPLGADLPPLRANGCTRKKPMGGNSGNDGNFHWQGIYFHFGLKLKESS